MVGLLRFFGALLRLYSYVFEAVLCLAALAFSAVVLASPHEQIRLGWLPWTGEALGAALAVFGLTGILLLFLAATGRVRLLFTLFAFAGFAVVTRGLFFSAWRFNGPAQAGKGALLALALLAAFIGSIPSGRSRADEFRRR